MNTFASIPLAATCATVVMDITWRVTGETAVVCIDFNHLNFIIFFNFQPKQMWMSALSICTTVMQMPSAQMLKVVTPANVVMASMEMEQMELVLVSYYLLCFIHGSPFILPCFAVQILTSVWRVPITAVPTQHATMALETSPACVTLDLRATESSVQVIEFKVVWVE